MWFRLDLLCFLLDFLPLKRSFLLHCFAWLQIKFIQLQFVAVFWGIWLARLFALRWLQFLAVCCLHAMPFSLHCCALPLLIVAVKLCYARAFMVYVWVYVRVCKHCCVCAWVHENKTKAAFVELNWIWNGSLLAPCCQLRVPIETVRVRVAMPCGVSAVKKYLFVRCKIIWFYYSFVCM